MVTLCTICGNLKLGHFGLVLLVVLQDVARSEKLASASMHRLHNTTTAIDFLLRGSHEAKERIIDTEALKDLNGVDPAADEFVFHPPGHEANVADYPYFAHWSKAMCGTTIIHDDILLTAGHCGRKATEPHWRKQMRFMSKYRESGGFTRNIAYLSPHPDFYQPAQVYDFQIIKASRSVLVDETGVATGAKVVTLNKDAGQPAPGDPIQAVGFGTVTPDGHTGNSQVLMDATLQAFDIDHCVHQYGEAKIKGEVMICVGTLDGSYDTCQGDSGGPMMTANDIQVGVVSWGIGCATVEHAGLASRVSAATTWIESEICRLSAMPPSTCAEGSTTSYDNRLPEPGTGEFDLRITVKHDISPIETAWSFTHRDSMTLLYFQPFESVPQPYMDVSHVFQDLKAGSYVFAISDAKKDGICCKFGKGSIAITDPDTEKVLWEHAGDFEEYLSVTLDLASDGSIVDVQEATAWINPSKGVSDANAPPGTTVEEDML